MLTRQIKKQAKTTGEGTVTHIQSERRKAPLHERPAARQNKLLASLLASAAAVTVGDPALAQQSSIPAAETGARLEEIVVTARRVQENLQDVPVAVTAISGEQLTQRNAVQISDIARLTPGFVIKPSSSTATAVNLQLRGQYQNELLATVDPSVGTYVDGYYWARAYGLNSDLLDVQSVQVLRGPQGTLFGRNTTGGALLIHTNNPSLSTYSAMVSGTYGRFDERSMTEVVNVPLVEDKLAVRLAGMFFKRGGYLDSVPYTFNGRTLPRQSPVANGPFSAGAATAIGGVGRKLGNRDNVAVRGKLLFTPTGNFSVLLSGEVYRYAAYGQSWRAGVVDPTSPANIQAGLELGSGLATASAVGQTFWREYIPFAQAGDQVAHNEDNYSFAKTKTFTMTGTLQLPIGELKYVGGLRKVESFANIDLFAQQSHSSTGHWSSPCGVETSMLSAPT